MGKAARLAESILDEYAESLPGGVTLIPSSGGVFDVSFAGQPVYSKSKAGRFPAPDEVETALANLLDA
ncbi:MAG: Rdx family protein [Thermomicrobiales bacterium]